MVVLAASIITKTGKVLVSRQFVDMSRIHIEGLLAAFPKLVGTNKQHTYVETEAGVRYVYQPMEALYLVMVTNKSSNILEDLESLRLLSKILPEYCATLDEETVNRFAFELICAFDEAISLGYKENVTLQQVKAYCEMESHEEKLHKMIIASKIKETEDKMKTRAQEIDKHKLDKARADRGGGGMTGFGGSGFSSSGGGGMGSVSSSDYNNAGGGGGMGGGSSGMGGGSSSARGMGGMGGGGAASAAGPVAPSKGMVLGKSAKKADVFLDAMRAEGESLEESRAPVRAGAAAVVGSAGPAEPVSIDVEEKITVLLKNDGGVENVEIQGTMALVVHSDDDAFLRVKVAGGANAGFQFKTHPNIDKALHAAEGILGLKDASRPFPTGSALGVLKWRLQGREESLVPLSLNCWPSASGGQTYVNIEYEAKPGFDLHGVVISIPLPALRDPPVINSVDGESRYNSRRSVLEWEISHIDATNRAGAMEFVVPACDGKAFFPISVTFTSPRTYCDIRVEGVTKTTTGAAVKYSSRTILAVDSYQVV